MIFRKLKNNRPQKHTIVQVAKSIDKRWVRLLIKYKNVRS